MTDPIPEDAPAWRLATRPPKEFPIALECRDLAVIVEVSNDVLPDVIKYLKREDLRPPAIGHVVYASLRGGQAGQPSQTAVRKGGHAFRLAERLCSCIHSYLGKHDVGTLHVFASCPNTLTFFLGRLSRKLGRIQLYEHAFEAEDKTKVIYVPSIRLPPESASQGERGE
jgi:hypothetical protein